ncbi:hypothetical protein, partial [Yersinia bercovieri]|uniref:hypothetical protein n=1 Tax=Yersinia bercovieri TaxID=634 RepID=UPI001C946551
ELVLNTIWDTLCGWLIHVFIYGHYQRKIHGGNSYRFIYTRMRLILSYNGNDENIGVINSKKSKIF